MVHFMYSLGGGREHRRGGRLGGLPRMEGELRTLFCQRKLVSTSQQICYQDLNQSGAWNISLSYLQRWALVELRKGRRRSKHLHRQTQILNLAVLWVDRDLFREGWEWWGTGPENPVKAVNFTEIICWRYVQSIQGLPWNSQLSTVD